MSWLTGWANRRKLTTTAGVTGTVEANFPAALFAPDLTGKVQADFDDAAVTDIDGTTVLDYSWEAKVAAAGVGHVRIPGTFAALQDVGYLYYNNPAATDQSDEAGTFAAYVARYSMGQASGAITDSLGLNHGTNVGADYGATGRIGDALDFESTEGDYVNLGSGATLRPQVLSLSAWIKFESLPGSSPYIADIISCEDTGFAGYVLRFIGGSTNRMDMGVMGGGGQTLASKSLVPTLGTWYHIAGTWDGTNAKVYVNGVAGTTGVGARTIAYSQPTNIARGPYYTTRQFDGLIDEVRIKNAVQSPSWLLAEQLSGAGTLLTIGAEETAGGGRALFLGPNLWTGGKALLREAEL